MSVTVENPDGSQTDVLVKDDGRGVYTITWTASMVGKHKVLVKFGGKEVPGSPFAVSALMKVWLHITPNNCTLYCIPLEGERLGRLIAIWTANTLAKRQLSSSLWDVNRLWG